MIGAGNQCITDCIVPRWTWRIVRRIARADKWRWKTTKGKRVGGVGRRKSQPWEAPWITIHHENFRGERKDAKGTTVESQAMRFQIDASPLSLSISSLFKFRCFAFSLSSPFSSLAASGSPSLLHVFSVLFWCCFVFGLVWFPFSSRVHFLFLLDATPLKFYPTILSNHSTCNCQLIYNTNIWLQLYILAQWMIMNVSLY